MDLIRIGHWYIDKTMVVRLIISHIDGTVKYKL